MEKFPDHVDAALTGDGPTDPGLVKSPTGFSIGGATQADQRQPRPKRESVAFPSRASSAGRVHGRQQSFSDAWRRIRNRNGSVGEHAHDIADALRAPVSPKLIVRIADRHNPRIDGIEAVRCDPLLTPYE